MDSFSQSFPAINDEVQQAHWIEETNKLWSEATGKNETFEFKTIDDVLEENALCKQENIRLHDIIDEEIATLKEDVASNKEYILHNEETISSVSSSVTINTKHITDNHEKISNTSLRIEVAEECINENSIEIEENNKEIDGLWTHGKLSIIIKIKSIY